MPVAYYYGSLSLELLYMNDGLKNKALTLWHLGIFDKYGFR